MIIKVCGLRDGENIRRVERLCPNMMGFICWEGSARYVARRPDYLPGVCKVGVFVNPTIEYVCTKAAELSLDRIQLHGEEPPEQCAEIGRAAGLPLIKAFSIGGESDIRACYAYENIPAIDTFLFDTRSTFAGGSGEKFDWSILRRYAGGTPFLLSGGIGPADAERITRFRHPQFIGIDINSCFETAPAVKDISKLKDFFNIIRN